MFLGRSTMVARTLGKNNREHSSGTDFVHPVIMPGCPSAPAGRSSTAFSSSGKAHPREERLAAHHPSLSRGSRTETPPMLSTAPATSTSSSAKRRRASAPARVRGAVVRGARLVSAIEPEEEYKQRAEGLREKHEESRRGYCGLAGKPEFEF